MFTFPLLSSLVSMAGPDFTWNGIPGCSEPSGGTRKGGRVEVGMRIALHAAQQGLCLHCGDAVAPESYTGSDLCHVVGSGKGKRGFVQGNIYLGHSRCNTGAAREAWEAGSVNGAYLGQHETRAAYLGRLVEDGASASITDANNAGYRLILTPADFTRPDLLVTEWPGSTVGSFIRFDPNFTGKR